MNALAVVRPDLLAEWDASANAPLRPARIKVTYDKAVTWRCADPKHPPYRMSPWARSRIQIGCRFCRRRVQADAARATNAEAA